MIPAMLQGLAIPHPEVFFIADPVTRETSIVLKVRLRPGLSLMGTIWLKQDLRPAIGLQIVTAMPEQMTITSPARPLRLI